MIRRPEMYSAHPRVVAGFLLVVAACASMARGQVELESLDDVLLPAPAQVVITASLTPGAPHSAIAIHTTISRCTVTPQADLLANAASVAFSSGLAPRDVASADLNQDGRIDLVISNASTGRVAILIQDATGGFGASYTPTAGVAPVGIASADLDLDGWPDIVTANYGADSVTVLLNNGDATFRKASEAHTGARPIDVAIADFDEDGLPDLVTTDQNANAVSIMLNLGGGAFGPASAVGVGSRPQSVVAADFDRDAHLDLAVANGNSGSITILRGDGAGGFTFAAELSSGAQPTSLHAEDMNLDGRLDLVAANAGQNRITIFEGRGDFLFQTRYLPTLYRPSSVSPADLNGDPLPDLIVARADTPHFDLLINASAYPGGDCPGDIDGDLWVSVYDFAIFATHFAQPTQSLTNGDLNGDEVVDIYDFAILATHFGEQCGES